MFRFSRLLTRPNLSPFSRSLTRTVSATRRGPISFISLVLGTSAGYGLFRMSQQDFYLHAEEKPIVVSDSLDGVQTINKIVLYQYEACPFCNKVRAFFDYNRIPYQVVEVNPLTKSELAFSKNYRKVPIAVVNDTVQLNDSTKIISSFTKHLHKNKKENEEEAKWSSWVDSHFVHVLSPNIYRTPKEAFDSFDYITKTGNFSYISRQSTRIVGATVMYFVAKKLKTKYNIKDERKSLYDGVNEWLTALQGRDFMGGKKPNLADLAVYGVLHAIEGLSAFDDLTANTNVSDWYNRVKEVVGPTTRYI
eukprot:TRINITY_DN84_c0_g1_i1.p1 TRINITY_DN84_c0_g1~~TRINITY_DN84_c0_g1_i1.p1  ORF type:complete len:306 (+),score=57.44 TRINITY_DN84_c0_g1_i1:48-965(+)